jgi:hypothetical protein
MTSHEKNRAALLREREDRRAAYVAALHERDSLMGVANSPDALEYDHRALARAEARVSLALDAMRHWRDPISPVEAMSDSVAPEALNTPRKPTGAADTVDAIVARILNA